MLFFFFDLLTPYAVIEAREVSSTVTLKSAFDLYTIGTLTVVGYFRYNGSTSTAYDGFCSAMITLYNKKSAITSYSSNPVYGYATVRGTFDLEMAINTQWAGGTFGTAEIVGVLYCNQNGNNL